MIEGVLERKEREGREALARKLAREEKPTKKAKTEKPA